MKVVAIALAGAVVASGCASYREKKAHVDWPWPTNERICKGEACVASEALDAYNRANLYCRNVHNRYARNQMGASTGRVVLSTIGAVSGSVIPPLVTGSAKEAWAGVSGSANALQGSMDQAFSASMSIQRRAKIAKAASDGAIAYQATNQNDTDRVIDAIDMARECSTAPATATQQALKAMME